jgi:hypothetical protein
VNCFFQQAKAQGRDYSATRVHPIIGVQGRMQRRGLGSVELSKDLQCRKCEHPKQTDAHHPGEDHRQQPESQAGGRGGMVHSVIPIGRVSIASSL